MFVRISRNQRILYIMIEKWKVKSVMLGIS